ncbi:MAG: hypothetical protein ACNA8N_08360 [Trueperaceae bacterium]
MVRFLLAAGVMSVCAQALAEAPAQFEVVEQFAARLSAGNLLRLRGVLSTDVVLVEHEAFVSVMAGQQVDARLRAWIAEGARLEVSFEFASADGAMIVTQEEMWLEGMPEQLLPLRSTGVYVVDGGRVRSVTRLLEGGQRDALMRDAIVGDWLTGGYVFSYHADGAYAIAQWGRPWDGGEFTIEGGVVRVVSDERSEFCEAGEVGLWSLSFAGPDRHTIVRIEDVCAAREGPTIVLRRME